MVLTTSTTTPKRLLWELVSLWLCAGFAAAGCPVGCRCSADGASASCSGLQGDTLPRGLATTVSTLDVSQNRLRAIDSHTFAELPLLQVLDVSRGRITQVSGAAFRGLPRLRRLVLSGNWLTAVPADAFPASLQELDLSRNPLPLPGSGPFLRADGVAALNLSHCAVSAVGADAFSQLPSLVRLDLSGNPLTLLSPLAFLGLRQLYVDEGSLGVDAYAVMQVVQDVVQVPRIALTTAGDITSEQQLSQADSDAQDPDTTAYTDKASEGGAEWPRDRHSFKDFSSLFGPVPQDAADSALFKGAPFQATGEVTVVYASDLRHLKDTLLVLGALAVLCFLLAAVQRALSRTGASRGNRSRCLLNRCLATAGRRQQIPDDGDPFWWDAELLWWEAGKPRGADLPPPYPYPPTYEDSLTTSVNPNSNDSENHASHQPASVHQARRQPDAVDNSRVSHSTNA